MVTIDTKGIVTEDGTLTVKVPESVTPGEHHVIVVIEDLGRNGQFPTLEFSAHDIGAWPPDFTVRREDIYGDDGR